MIFGRAKLGSKKRPAIARVQDPRKAQKILEICSRNDWQIIVGIEPDEKEDISDFEKLLGSEQKPVITHHKKGRNELCDCGSGKKYKKCCLVMQA